MRLELPSVSIYLNNGSWWLKTRDSAGQAVETRLTCADLVAIKAFIDAVWCER